MVSGIRRTYGRALGGAGDQPLVGDWDGDGKSDIGVFGLDADSAS